MVYQTLKDVFQQVFQGCDYMVFRDGIKPEWTDKMNVDGGRWLLEIDRQYRNEQLNSKWLETLLAIIGTYENVFEAFVTGLRTLI